MTKRIMNWRCQKTWACMIGLYDEYLKACFPSFCCGSVCSSHSLTWRKSPTFATMFGSFPSFTLWLHDITKYSWGCSCAPWAEVWTHALVGLQKMIESKTLSWFPHYLHLTFLLSYVLLPIRVVWLGILISIDNITIFSSFLLYFYCVCLKMFVNVVLHSNVGF